MILLGSCPINGYTSLPSPFQPLGRSETYLVCSRSSSSEALLTWSSVTFTLPKPSTTILVLSQLDYRFFEDISGRYNWTFDFIVFKKGEKEYLAHSAPSRLYCRSVNLEMDLEAGDYVVHVGVWNNLTQPSTNPDMNR